MSFCCLRSGVDRCVAAASRHRPSVDSGRALEKRHANCIVQLDRLAEHRSANAPISMTTRGSSEPLTLRHQILSGLRWSAGVRLGSQLFTWVVTLVVVRLLAPEDYGLLSMAMVFVGFLYMVAEFGLGPAVVQKADVSETELRKAFGLVVVIHAVLCVSLAAAAPLIAAFFAEPRL